MAELNGVAVDVGQLKALALTNYGHFTSMRVENDHVRGLTLHLERLLHDCRSLFGAALDPDWVRHLVRRLMTGADGPMVVRVTVFDPDLGLGSPGAEATPQVLVTTRPATQAPQSGLRLQSATYRRDVPEVKHVGLFGALRLRRLAQRDGFDDVLFTEDDATISEVATSNIGFVDGDRVIWPRARCLPGVTMRLINQTRDQHVHSAPITLADIPKFEAAFATNAAVGLRPVTAVDEVTWSAEHPALRALRKEYADIPPERL